MKLKFKNLSERYRSGMSDFLSRLSIEEGDGSFEISIETEEKGYTYIHIDGKAVTFRLDREYQVFRSVISFLSMREKGECEYTERSYFKTLGVMFDGSQKSSLMNLQSAKRMMLILAGMGFNMMMLYCEDCYEVEGEPYFGNMRPRYSKKELRELDDYAYSLGIEMIPCIQTLGHLREAIKRPPYNAISDTNTVILAGDERVYTLLDRMIMNISSCFRSRRIHLGLDEAWNLGLGKYLRKNGYTEPDKIMKEHLERVCSIAREQKLMPMMWGDMFFRNKSPDGDYYKADISFSEEEKASVPDNMSLIYWDYYHKTPEEYEAMLHLTRELREDVLFAGCVRNVRTFAGNYKMTEETTAPALIACKRTGVSEVFATVWGDDHTESSSFTALPGLQLYAEHAYSEVPDTQTVKARFEITAGVPWQAFMDINDMDNFIGKEPDNSYNYSLTRAIMWQDIMLGLYDDDLGDADYMGYYSEIEKRLKRSAEQPTEYKKMFEFYHALARVLKTKAQIGIRLKKAYDSGDRDALVAFAEEILPALKADIEGVREANMEYFFEEYKPIGWEIMDIRYGGSIMRADTAIRRICDYLSGRVLQLEELEEVRLPYFNGGSYPERISYGLICSASTLTEYT